MRNTEKWRKSSQYLMPASDESSVDGYNIYPSFHLDDNRIFNGYDGLAAKIANSEKVIIDGYIGVFFEEFREYLDAAFLKSGIEVAWHNFDSALKEPAQVEELVNPFLGGNDPIFGKRTTLHLIDFFDERKLNEIKPKPGKRINIIYGCGAMLAGWEGTLIYLDLPKNEIQYRSRAGSITNLGVSQAADPKVLYKRFYFVDWVVLNKHKQEIFPHIDLFVD